MMENFENHIFSLFEKYGYGCLGQLQAGKYLFKHHTNDDYWIVTEGLMEENEQFELYKELTKVQAKKYPCANKNTSILLLVNMEKYEDEVSVVSRFVRLENDPLYFKKYVLPFTQSSYEDMMKVAQEKKAQSFEDLIMRDETFEDLKNGEGYANLLYSIVHKLPFIPIEAVEQKEFHQELTYSSEAIKELADSLDDYPENSKYLDGFIEELITDYEDEKN